MARRVNQDNPADGDRAEMAAIVREALPHIYGFILMRVAGNRAVAEDLTSDTLLAFSTSWPEQQNRIPDPTAWLIGIARHKVFNHYRAQTSRSRYETDWSEAAEQTPEIASEFERIADRDELFRLLGPLPVEHQIVLLLRYLDGYSVRETAELIGKSEHAVEAMLGRAKRAIRDAVRTHGETQQ